MHNDSRMREVHSLTTTQLGFEQGTNCLTENHSMYIKNKNLLPAVRHMKERRKKKIIVEELFSCKSELCGD